MCFCSQQYKLTDSLFSCANICCAHFKGALKRGFKKAYLHEINAFVIFKYILYIQVSTFHLSFEDTFKRGLAHDTIFFIKSMGTYGTNMFALWVWRVDCAIKVLWGLWADSQSIVQLWRCYQLFLMTKGITGSSAAIVQCSMNLPKGPKDP